jgi:hypothetical protein
VITRRRLLAMPSAVLSLPLWSRVTGARKSAPEPDGVFEVQYIGEESHHLFHDLVAPFGSSFMKPERFIGLGTH